MILARWQGFEIDSSEGYYVFAKEMDHIDEGWRLLSRLLDSPLVWKSVGIRLQPRQGREKNLEAVLSEWRTKKLVWTEKRDEFAAPIDVISASGVLGLFQEIRTDLGTATVLFAMVPPRMLKSYAYRKLRQWFFRQFAGEETAKARWASYRRIRAEDIKLSGHTGMTDLWTDAMGLEATLEIGLESPFEYKVFVPAVDPTMIVYLLRSLTNQFYLVFEGEHYISINLTPDYLSIAKLRPEPGAEESIEVIPGPGKSLARLMEHLRKEKTGKA